MLFNFNWQTFFDCNYNCSYCIQKNKTKNNETKEERYQRLLRQATQIKSLINNLEPEYDIITLTFLGGEISLLTVDEVKHIFDNLLTDRLVKVRIITNLSASISWYKEVLYYLKDHNIAFFIIASFHEEYANVNTFFDKAEELNKIVKETPRNDEQKIKNNFRITTVITKENKDTFGSLFLSNAVSKNLNYQFNYNRLEKWTKDEEYKTIEGDFHFPEWKEKQNTEDIFGYTCSSSYYGVNIAPNGFITGNVSCGDCPLGILGLTKKIVHKEIICKKHHCNMCGKVRLTRPDGSLFLTNMAAKEL